MKRPSLDSPPVKCYKLYAIVYAGDWRHEAREVFRHGDYPLGNRLYHFVIVLAAVAVVVTGLFMMVRVRTPFVGRNPYLFGDAAWGLTYVTHGAAGVALVGLVMAHVYSAVRPDKWWITKSMILGWITRRQYLEHHDPQRWVAETGAAKPFSRV